MVSVGDGLGLLSLVKDISNKTRNLNIREVTACSDNKHVLNKIENALKRESEHYRGWGNS